MSKRVMVTSVVLAGLSAVTIWGQVVTGQSTARTVLDVVAAIVATGIVPVLLRRPLVGAVPLTLLAALSPAATPQATASALLVALNCRLPLALAIGALGVAAHAIQGLWRPHGGLSYGWWLAFLAASYAALIAWGSLWQANRKLVESLCERARRAEADQAHRVAEARTRERARIAHEMHDVLAHRLTLLATYAGAVQYRPDSSPDQLTAAAAVVRESAQRALDDLREVITVLREDIPSEARPQPSMSDIPSLLDESRAAGVQIDLDDQVDGDGLPAGAQRTAYRVVQEAVTNARRHAPGAPVRVQLAGEPGQRLRVEVSNPMPPTGPDPGSAAGSGTGLIGLAERVSLAGGELDTTATDGVFRVRAWLPWPG